MSLAAARQPCSHMSPVISHVERFIARWYTAPRSLKHLRNGANSVYEFQSGTSRLIIRLTDNRHRTHEQLDAELDFVRFVAAHGVRAACPVPSARGAVVETLEVDDGMTWHAVVFPALPGRHFRFFSCDIDQPLFHAWGSAMGRLHAASRGFVPVSSRRRPSWAQQDSTCCDLTRLPPRESEARREHARVFEWLASLPRSPSLWGLIHGDFERTNFLIDGNTLGIYDFDDACYHWYIADVAHALWAFRAAPPRDRGRFLSWFMDGYADHCSLEADVREQLSWFVRLRSLSLFLHKLQRATRRASDLQWEARLRAGFEAPFSW
jgi:Ser/Thr protein kinase RdoA (MazF antagonist)